MEKEETRGWRDVWLIALKTFASLAASVALGTHLTNKYLEGLLCTRRHKCYFIYLFNYFHLSLV
uniref:Uncharacterized protein n=2 Tax=Physcomitrium patens TaxID=3218 RepID=A0A2K1JR12_PHYPA|nr:hypothetical protein PHYPA_016355 [Physcomitrium patens]